MAAHPLSNEVWPSQLVLQPLTCPQGRSWCRWEQIVGEELSKSRKSDGFVLVREHLCGEKKVAVPSTTDVRDLCDLKPKKTHVYTNKQIPPCTWSAKFQGCILNGKLLPERSNNYREKMRYLHVYQNFQNAICLKCCFRKHREVPCFLWYFKVYKGPSFQQSRQLLSSWGFS